MATSHDETGPINDELRPTYDFRALRGVVRGKYAARYRERLRVVRLADDVAAAFADEAAVNNALREYLLGLLFCWPGNIAAPAHAGDLGTVTSAP